MRHSLTISQRRFISASGRYLHCLACSSHSSGPAPLDRRAGPGWGTSLSLPMVGRGRNGGVVQRQRRRRLSGGRWRSSERYHLQAVVRSSGGEAGRQRVGQQWACRPPCMGGGGCRCGGWAVAWPKRGWAGRWPEGWLAGWSRSGLRPPPSSRTCPSQRSTRPHPAFRIPHPPPGWATVGAVQCLPSASEPSRWSPSQSPLHRLRSPPPRPRTWHRRLA